MSELVTNSLNSRDKAEKVKKGGDIFEAKQEACEPSEQRETD